MLPTRAEATAPASLVRGKQHAERDDSMKNKVKDELEDELRAEYDFSQLKAGVKGKYVERYRAGTNMVLLEPDVAKAFPTDETVNQARRLLMEIAIRRRV